MGYVAVGTAWGFKIQSAFGTPGVVDKWIPFISETTTKKYETLEIVDSESRFKQVNGSPLGRLMAEGDVTTYVEPNNIGYPLKFLMGSCSTASGSPVAGANTHTFRAANEIPYFTTEFKYGTVTDSKGKRLYDCKMKGATFDFADDMLTVTWNMHASDYSGGVTAVSITNPTGRKFTYKDVKSGAVPGIIVTIGGTATSGVKIKTGSLQVENGLITDDYYQGSQTVQQLDAGKFTVTGNFELIFDNAATLDSWLSGSEKAQVEVRYEGDIVTGSTRDTIKFVVPNCYVTNHSIPMTHNEVIVRQVEFEGFYDKNASDPKTLEVVLINGTNAHATDGYA